MRVLTTRRWTAAATAALVLFTLAAFSPLWNAGFINFDDPGFVTKNPQVAQGLTRGSVRWALTTTERANWYPLTRLSHLLDVQLYGLSPRGHHMSNLALHLASAAVLFLALAAASGAPRRSLAVAALFAVHPLHVESVAWVSERSDVLAGLCWSITLALYVWYARRPGWLRYLLLALAFCGGLLAKPTVVSLPLVLLLFDFWPLGRLGAAGKAGTAPLPPWRVVGEKVPLLLLAAATAAVVYRSQLQGGAMNTVFGPLDTLKVTLPQVPLSYLAYLGKTVWPTGLAVFYPHPGHGVPLGRSLAAAAVLVLVGAAALWQRRRRPWAVVGWSWYFVALFPMIGFVQVGSQSMADRYSYLPLTGIFIVATWGLAELSRRMRAPRGLARAAAACLIALLACLTFRQAGFWRDDRTLFNRALAVTGEGNWVAHKILGGAAFDAGDMRAAAAHYEAVLAVRPLDPVCLFNGAMALAAIDRRDEAIARFSQAARLNPKNFEARFNLGVLLLAAGRAEEAEARLREALALEPGHPRALAQLVRAQRARGKREEAP